MSCKDLIANGSTLQDAISVTQAKVEATFGPVCLLIAGSVLNMCRSRKRETVASAAEARWLQTQVRFSITRESMEKSAKADKIGRIIALMQELHPNALIPKSLDFKATSELDRMYDDLLSQVKARNRGHVTLQRVEQLRSYLARSSWKNAGQQSRTPLTPQCQNIPRDDSGGHGGLTVWGLGFRV